MHYNLVVIGASTGGLKALQVLLSSLPAEFPLPVAIVQHRGNDSESLSEFLRESSKLRIKEPEDKDPIEAGNVYLAPRDYHLLVDNQGFALSTESPVAYARPSIDVLFESAAEEFEDRVIGVILTGANRDGARGLKKIKVAGGLAIVESPESARCREMPDAAIALAAVDWVLPLEEIGPCLEQLSNCGGSQAEARPSGRARALI